MALSGYAISGDVYAWAAVFILPVNSALNPILYTLTAIVGKKVLKHFCIAFPTKHRLCYLVIQMPLRYNVHFLMIVDHIY
jgi:hypothetical protein